MPGFYDEGKYDVAGFGVGIAERDDIVTGEKISEGDVLIGISSTGVHSNGFSLVRKLVTDFNEKAPFDPEKTMGEVLLAPTRIYVRPVLDVLNKFPGAVHGMVHVTGGGFYENIPRMYPAANEARVAEGKKPLISVIKKGSWEILPIFEDLIRRGANPDRMFNTFNMGIGFVMAVSADKADAVCEALANFASSEDAGLCANMKAYKIGFVKEAEGEAETQEQQVIFE